MAAMINFEEIKRLNGKSFVESVYNAILLRNADKAGLDSFEKALANGTSKDQIIYNIAVSEEAMIKNVPFMGLRLSEINVHKLMTYLDEQFVTVAYIALLGRTPDPSGKNHFLSELRAGNISKEEILYSLSASEEGQKAGVKAEGLNKIYKKRMRRKAVYKIPLIGRIIRSIWNMTHVNRLVNAKTADIHQRMTFAEKRAQYFENYIKDTNNGVLGAMNKRIDISLGNNNNTNLRVDDVIKSLHNTNVRVDSAFAGIHNTNVRADNAEARITQLNRNTEIINNSIGNINNDIIKVNNEIVKNIIIDEKSKSFIGDLAYRKYEDMMRGSRKEIKERLNIYESVVKRVKANNGDDIYALDLGCGRGEWLELMEEKYDVQALGVDSDRSMLDDCYKNSLNAVQCDLLVYLRNAESCSVDIISMFQVVEHLPVGVLVQVLKEAYRVLRTGGAIIMETPNPESMIVGACNFYFDPTHIKPIPPAILNILAESAEFTETEIARMHPYNAIEIGNIDGDSVEQNAIKQIAGFLNNYSDYAVIGFKK